MRQHLRYLELSGYTPASIYSRRRALTRLAAVLPAGLLGATGQDLAAWRESLTVGDAAAATYVAHVRQFYAWAVGEGLLEVSPALRLPAPKTRRGLPRPIGEPELFTALDAAAPRIRPWLVLAGWCGLRAREIALLRRECVLDTAAPAVLVVTADAGKGRRERVIPLCGFALAELRAHGLPRSGFVFRRHDGQPGPNQPWLVSQLANQHLHACGTSSTLHSLRHRFGTQAYRASHDLRAVQELLGHAVPQSTAGYTAFDVPVQSAAVAALPVPRRLLVVRDDSA